MSKSVLLSTDIGSDIDDALALSTIINSGINLKGIYTVNGDVSSRSYIAKDIVRLYGKDIEIGAGESEPIGGKPEPYSFFEDCYVDDTYIDKTLTGMKGDIVLKPVSDFGIEKDGVESMAKKIYEGGCTVMSIGPLTNLAVIIKKYPNLAEKIEKLYVMGCRFGEEDLLEHNVNYDVPAAQMVFDSKIPILVVPGDVCEKYRMPVEKLEKLNTEGGKYIKRMAKGFLGANTANTFGGESLAKLIEEFATLGADYVSKNAANGKVIIDNIDKKKKLVANLDRPVYGAFDPKAYFKQYNELMEHLRNPELNYDRGNILATALELATPKDLSVADVYIPYAFNNPGKLTIEKSEIKIRSDGVNRKTNGNKHMVVRDLDFNDFSDFINNFLK